MSDDKTDQTSLIPAIPHGLTARSTNLVRRGLDRLMHKDQVAQERLQRVLSSNWHDKEQVKKLLSDAMTEHLANPTPISAKPSPRLRQVNRRKVQRKMQALATADDQHRNLTEKSNPLEKADNCDE